MATYFQGANEIQPESMQTLFLMNPNLATYSDAHMILLNPPTNTLNLTRQSQTQHLVGIPIQSQDSVRPSPINYNNLWTQQQGLSLSLPTPEVAAWVSGRNEEAKVFGSQSPLINSKYLRLAQQLLDEVVSVWNGTADRSMKGEDIKPIKGEENGIELTTAEKQELQMRKAKLVNMLDEVGQRYKRYKQQMQLVVSSFEAAAGFGSAKTYTALALRTISRQFRCLRDAITGQIRAAAKSLGEEQFTEEGAKSNRSRLQFIDQQVRQQRALQQLGMTHHNAWRPQRGLPERAVSVLRAWLFEHFLHPYPKDSDKQILAKQTGLTRSQVSNWFINARVRLWKPMVEEMYKEELKEQERSNGDEITSDANVIDETSSKSNAQPEDCSYVNNGEDDDSSMQSKMNKSRNEDHGCSSNTGYSVREIERFGLDQFTSRLSGNSVSLTLGLTQYGNLPQPGAQPPYMNGNCFSVLGSDLSVVHSTDPYDSIDIESRKRFAAHLLPDFVAYNR